MMGDKAKEYDWAPVANSPRDYVELKLGRVLTIGDAQRSVGREMMEAFEAGENSQLVGLLEIFKKCRSYISKNRKSYLREELDRMIERAEGYKKKAAKKK